METKLIRDKFLTEVMGECWHDLTNPDDKTLYGWCPKCGMRVCRQWYGPDAPVIQDHHFQTWPGFGKLWEWAQKQEWWDDFWAVQICDNRGSDLFKTHVHPDRFADALYTFLKEKQNG